MIEKKGWIEGAEIIKSPNFDERNDDVTFILIHYIITETIGKIDSG